ncbi:ROK family transcriptional regulator, partial [Actinotalea sp. C106]|uniref:ROK family transcriptional regulator n=1 Tax=Actinotalea sp. C106 TaxID=2908644 RepID=UPI002029637B
MTHNSKEGLLTNMSTQALRPTGKVLPEHARAHHRSMVLQHLFHTGPVSRADLARATGLTRVTISDLVTSLQTDGLVTELGAAPGGRVGKPATLLGLRDDAFQVVAVDLTDDEHMLGAVLDVFGTVVERRSTPLDGRTGDAVVEALIDLCRELVGLATYRVLGVGVASPGVIDASGTVLEAPNRAWYDVPLAALVSEALGLPAHVGNDANAAVLGELTYGGASPEGLLALTVGEGVGAGIVLDGRLVAGHRHAAGELGHVTVVDDRDDVDHAPLGRAETCACGRRGCLETVLSVPALRRRVAGLDEEAA